MAPVFFDGLVESTPSQPVGVVGRRGRLVVTQRTRRGGQPSARAQANPLDSNLSVVASFVGSGNET